MIESLGELFGPFFSSCLVLGPVGLVDLGDLWHQGVIRVGVSQQRRNGEQHFGDCQSRRPLVLQNIKTDGAVGIDIGVVDFGGEIALGRPEGVVSGETDIEEEDTSRIGAVFRTHNGGLPMELVSVDWAG